MTKILVYLAAALAVAIPVTLIACRRQKPWAELSFDEKRKRAGLMAILGIMACASILASGTEFKRYLDREKEIGHMSLSSAMGLAANGR